VVLDFTYLNPHIKVVIKDIPLLIVMNKNELLSFQRIMHDYQILDYFLTPVDPQLFITRIHFLLEQKKDSIHSIF